MVFICMHTAVTTKKIPQKTTPIYIKNLTNTQHTKKILHTESYF